ncbi:hypothetical protein H0H87_004417, partial [Tephrocybe sp. NHM501043]
MKKKIIKGFGKVGRKFDSFLSSKRSRSKSPARDSAQVTSGFSPATRVSDPLPDVVSDGNTATDVALTASMDLHVTNPAVSTQGNLSQVAEIPSITVDLGEIDSASAIFLTSGEIGTSVVQASTGMLATGPLQVSGSPGAETMYASASTGNASQVADHSAPAQDLTGTNTLSILAQLIHVDPTTAPNTKIKSELLTAWSGKQMLLSRAEGLLAGTPFKTPVAAVNVLIKLGNVCPLGVLYTQTGLSQEQDVAENNDALKDIIARTEDRLNTVATALAKEDDTVAHAMFHDFAGILIDKILELHLMSKKATWKKILESDDDKTKISRMFKEIDEQTKNFH